MGLFGEERVKGESMAERLARYERTKPLDWKGQPRFADQVEANRVLNVYKSRPDLVEAMYAKLLNGEVGKKLVKDTDMAKRVYWAIRDLGLEVKTDEKDPNKLIVVNPEQKNEVPRLEHKFPMELVNLDRKWRSVSVEEIKTSLPGQPEKREKFVVLETSQRDALTVLRRQDAELVDKTRDQAYADLFDCMYAGNGQVKDTPAYYLIKCDEEVEGILDGVDGKTDRQTWEKISQGKLDFDNWIKQKAVDAPGCAVITHGFAGRMDYSKHYELIAQVQEVDEEAIIVLASVMGADGTKADMGNGRGLVSIDQTDQSKQQRFFLAENGMYYYAVGGRWLMVIGHSMGGEATMETAAGHEESMQDLRREFTTRGMKTVSQDGEVKSNEFTQRLKKNDAEMVILLKESKALRGKLAQLNEHPDQATRWLRALELELGMDEDEAKLKLADLNRLVKEKLDIEDGIRAEEVEWMKEHGMRVVETLNTTFSLQIIHRSEQPCFNDAVSKPLTGRVMGFLLDTGHVIGGVMPGVVDTTGQTVNVAQRVFGSLKWGLEHANRHAKSISAGDNPTAEQLKGIRESEGPDQEMVDKINEADKVLIVLSQGDNTLDYSQQVAELARMGVRRLVIHIEDADHFGFASPEHAAVSTKWNKVMTQLDNEEWKELELMLREAKWTGKDGVERDLIPRGLSPLGVCSAQEWVQRLNVSGVAKKWIEKWGDFDDSEKSRLILEAVAASMGHLSFGA